MRSAVLIGVLLLSVAGLSAEEADLRDLGSADPAVRAAAAERLLALGDKAGPLISEGLKSENVQVALACADLAARGAHRRARRELVRLVKAPDTPRVLTRAACRALGVAGDYRDLEVLAGLAPSIPEAALAMVEIGEPEARDLIATAFGDGSGASAELAYSLATFGDARGFERLIALFGEGAPGASLYLRRLAGKDIGPDAADWQLWWRRRHLARALGSDDWKESEKALQKAVAAAGETSGDLLAIASDTGEPQAARAKALLALGRIGNRAHSAALLGILKNDGDGMVRVYAAGALGRIGDAAVAPDLAYYLIFDEEPFRKLSKKTETAPYFTIDSEVCKALVRMGVKGGLDFMVRQLGQQHRVRVYHEALRAFEGAQVRSFEFRPDGNTTDRLRAAAAVRRWFDAHRSEIRIEGNADFSDPRFRKRVAELVDRLDHFQFLFMSRARETLVLLGDTALPELIAGLSRPETHLRAHCAEVLARIGAKSARGPLARLLRDPANDVRASAAAALADLGPGEQAGALIEALGDESPEVRIEAARGMARVEDKRAALAALEAALTEERNDLDSFRREAWFARAAHGDVSAVESLAAVLTHPAIAIRRIAADRLAVLTGRDPGVEADSVAEWSAFWKESRERYTGMNPDVLVR